MWRYPVGDGGNRVTTVMVIVLGGTESREKWYSCNEQSKNEEVDDIGIVHLTNNLLIYSRLMNIIDFGSGDESRIAEHYRARPDATSSYRRSLHDLGVPTETQITVHCIDPLLTRESEMPTETENTQIQTYRHISELTCEKVNGILVIHPNPLVHSVLFERR